MKNPKLAKEKAPAIGPYLYRVIRYDAKGKKIAYWNTITLHTARCIASEYKDYSKIFDREGNEIPIDPPYRSWLSTPTTVVRRNNGCWW